jgi:hypothetical protein
VDTDADLAVAEALIGRFILDCAASPPITAAEPGR